MAHVVSNNNGNTSLSTTTPFMDRLTHAVIKETSKSLRYYIDVKRRENAFVLNPNSSSLDSIPLKARFIYGTTKEYPPLYGSYHSDNDVKTYLRNFQQQKKQSYSTSSSPEKQMCREELNFHMRAHKYSPRESQKFAELNLKLPRRSSSSCSGVNNSDHRKRNSKSSLKLSRYEQEQLIDNTANILASMIKTRRSMYQTNLLSQQTLPNYVSQNTNPSPRQTDDLTNPSSLTQPSTDLKHLTTTQQSKKSKRTTENILAQATSIMNNAEPIKKSILCEYKVSITTGNCNGASTNAPVNIKFYGTNGYTKFDELKNSETHRIPFLKDQTDVFTIETDHVGQLAGITIGHNQKDLRSSWFLSKVSIYDPIRDITYNIPCNAWLSSQSNDHKTLRDFQVASIISHKKRTDYNEHENQSGYSTTTESTTSSNIINKNDYKQIRKNSIQQRLSIDSITNEKSPKSLNTITNHLSQPSPSTTIESHFNQNQFSSPLPIPTRRIRSPNISSDTDTGDDTIINDNRPTTPVLHQSRKQSHSDHYVSQTTTNDNIKRPSIEYNRPPARLEKRHSPISLSSEQPIKTKNKTNDDDVDSFFE